MDFARFGKDCSVDGRVAQLVILAGSGKDDCRGVGLAELLAYGKAWEKGLES